MKRGVQIIDDLIARKLFLSDFTLQETIFILQTASNLCFIVLTSFSLTVNRLREFTLDLRKLLIALFDLAILVDALFLQDFLKANQLFSKIKRKVSKTAANTIIRFRFFNLRGSNMPCSYILSNTIERFIEIGLNFLELLF